MLDEIFQNIEKPGRYIGGEINAASKPFDKARIRFALAFPDVYEVGQSHLGIQILYHLLNGMNGVMADRVFAPWPDFERRLLERGEPLRTLECRRPLKDFDFIGFSLQYELCYTNLLTMLHLSSIPFAAARREESSPWIVAGGPCAFNAEPLADFLDLVVLGEAEEVLPELLQAFEAWRASGEERKRFLEAASDIAGIYVPSLFEPRYLPDGRLEAVRPIPPASAPATKRTVWDLDRASPPSNRPLVPLVEIIHDRLGVEIARGCTRGCRFCQAGFIYRPVRERKPEAVLEHAVRAVESSGFDEISLLSLSTGDYCAVQPLLASLVERFRDRKVAVSLPSMRVGTLTPELMELIRSVRKTGFTVAPEAGSERLRKVVNKNILDADLLHTAESCFDLGWRLLKLYFMIGLPTETAEDRDALVERTLEVWRLAKSRKASVNVSVSTFVPKPWTPFQWEPQISPEAMEDILSSLKKRLRRPGVRFKWSDPAQSFLEGVLARGDRRLSAVLIKAWELGARFDGWGESFQEEAPGSPEGSIRREVWRQAFQETGLDPSFYARRRRDREEVLPWDHSSPGVSKEFLWAEYRRALAGAFTDDCRRGVCRRCGACDPEAQEPVIHERDEALLVGSPKTTGAKGSDPAPSPPTCIYELLYSKTDDIRFIGQLEVSRAFERAVRRSRLPAAFSQGFHPHIKLSFDGALPLGLESLVERAHLTLTENVDEETVKERLNLHLPRGLSVHGVRAVAKRSPAPAKSRVVYEIRGLSPEEARSLEKEWARRRRDPLIKKTRKREVRVPLGEVVLDLRSKNGSWVRMELMEAPQVCFRPGAVLEHLLDGFPQRSPACRVRKVAAAPLEEDENVCRAHHQC